MGDRLPRQRLFDRAPQVMTRGGGPSHADLVLIIDATLVNHTARRIDQEDLGRPRGTNFQSKPLIKVFDHRKSKLVLGNVRLYLGHRILTIAVDAKEANTLRGKFISHRLQSSPV